MNRFIIAMRANASIPAAPVKRTVVSSGKSGLRRLTPQSFLPRIHVIKGVNVSTATACRQCEDAAYAPTSARTAPSAVSKGLSVMQERCIG